MVWSWRSVGPVSPKGLWWACIRGAQLTSYILAEIVGKAERCFWSSYTTIRPVLKCRWRVAYLYIKPFKNGNYTVNAGYTLEKRPHYPSAKSLFRPVGLHRDFVGTEHLFNPVTEQYSKCLVKVTKR